MLSLIKFDGFFWQISQHTLCNCESKHRINDKSNASLKCIWPYCGLLACSLPFLRRVLDLSWSRGRKLDENRVKVDKRPSSFTAAACCCRRRGASVAPYAPRYSCWRAAIYCEPLYWLLCSNSALASKTAAATRPAERSDCCTVLRAGSAHCWYHQCTVLRGIAQREAGGTIDTLYISGQ